MGEIVRQRAVNMTAKELVLESAARSNILPIISTCNVRCRFCSHGQNPPSAEVLRMPPISMDLLDDALSLMDQEKPVVIGESVTRLMEGEPLLHPNFREILKKIRVRMPRTEIRLTTNGTLLDREAIEFLALLGRVTICLSLNSSDVSVRNYLMNDPRAEMAVTSAARLKDAGICFHGSVVAMPHLTGWKDLAGTLEFLDSHGAVTVRVFSPGYTRFSPSELRLSPDFGEQLESFIAAIRPRLSVPVTLETPVIRDLRAEVAGVTAGSPAWRAGMMAGDIISSVDRAPVFSRVDAFKRVLAGSNPVVEAIRNGQGRSFVIVKEKGRSSGLVLDYDIDPAAVEEIIRAAARRRARRSLLLASEMGYPVVKMALEKAAGGRSAVHAVPVKNNFFGGSIGCAGLLTVDDMLDVVDEYRERADLIIVPGIAFDTRGRDMAGRSFLDLEIAGGPPMEVI